MTHLTELALSLPSDLASSNELWAPGGTLEDLPPGQMVQFHGKWPFRRFFGTQEILSVIFSLLNLIAHWDGLVALAKTPCRTTEGLTLRRDYRLNAWIGINTWIWSAVFHTRDVGWTEKADYFSAGASTLYGLWLALDRLGHLYRPTRSGGSSFWRIATRWLFLSVLLAHCSYLSIGRFDYGYNMLFNVAVGVSQILLWIAWAFAPASAFTHGTRPPHQRGPVLPAVLILASTSLELLDFQPIPSGLRLLDAHALWHLATVPLVREWYRFLRKDLEWIETTCEDRRLR